MTTMLLKMTRKPILVFTGIIKVKKNLWWKKVETNLKIIYFCWFLMQYCLWLNIYR